MNTDPACVLNLYILLGWALLVSGVLLALGALFIEVIKTDTKTKKFLWSIVWSIIFIMAGIICIVCYYHQTHSLWIPSENIPSDWIPSEKKYPLSPTGQFILLTALVTSTLTLIIISAKYHDTLIAVKNDKNDKKLTIVKKLSIGVVFLNFIIIAQFLIVSLLLIRIILSSYSCGVLEYDRFIIISSWVMIGSVWPVYFYLITPFLKRYDK